LRFLRWALLLWAGPAVAAGGTHVVDDAPVETPGVCNSELFGKHFGPGRRTTTATLNCTFKAAPQLELGLALARTRDRGALETAFGPAFKWNFVEGADDSPGLAVVGVMKVAAETGRVEFATLFVPLTLALADGFAFSLNAGWQHVRLADRPDSMKVGGQVEAAVADGLCLMAELFATVGDRPGAQTGLRWTPAEAFDMDLTLGHKVDGVSTLSAAAGLTFRF
jgi:hypothetical protein